MIGSKFLELFDLVYSNSCEKYREKLLRKYIERDNAFESVKSCERAVEMLKEIKYDLTHYEENEKYMGFLEFFENQEREYEGLLKEAVEMHDEYDVEVTNLRNVIGNN